MAWPKKGTRKIVIDGVSYLWHYSGHCPCCSDDVFTIGTAGNPFVLFIDPFPWNFEYKPSAIIGAIQWAKKNGWSPEKGPTRAMALDDQNNKFMWLRDDQRHLSCADKKEREIKP